MEVKTLRGDGKGWSQRGGVKTGKGKTSEKN